MGKAPSVRRLTRIFTAVGADGWAYTVHVYTWFNRAYGLGGQSVEVEGRRKFATSTGLGVTRIRRGRYHIDAIGIALRSDDPAAP